MFNHTLQNVIYIFTAGIRKHCWITMLLVHLQAQLTILQTACITHNVHFDTHTYEWCHSKQIIGFDGKCVLRNQGYYISFQHREGQDNDIGSFLLAKVVTVLLCLTLMTTIMITLATDEMSKHEFEPQRNPRQKGLRCGGVTVCKRRCGQLQRTFKTNNSLPACLGNQNPPGFIFLTQSKSYTRVIKVEGAA